MLKKLSWLTLLMLAIPVSVWLLDWQWQPSAFSTFDQWLLLLTETGSAPYALISCVVLMLCLMWLARGRYSWFLVGFLCASSVVGTQVIKEGAKAVFKEPRPFVEVYFKQNSASFYALPKAEQEAVVLQFSQSENAAVVAHQADELGYSFPSGHTIFAVSWLLMFGGLLFQTRGQAVFFAQFLAILWAGAMLVSRLRLGMHYPIDLFASSLIAWLFHLILFIVVVPKLEQWRWFQHPNHKRLT